MFLMLLLRSRALCISSRMGKQEGCVGERGGLDRSLLASSINFLGPRFRTLIFPFFSVGTGSSRTTEEADYRAPLLLPARGQLCLQSWTQPLRIRSPRSFSSSLVSLCLSSSSILSTISLGQTPCVTLETATAKARPLPADAI